jgi:AcrR family transcriptional regulator
MGRTALTADDHATFRTAMRAVATRRFAEHGEAGVTMRGLAEDLGCSPMTPYRYFRDRDEIFAMVRNAAIEAFVESQERAYRTARDPLPRLRALARAYAAYAVAHPDQYRVMFQLGRHPSTSSREAALTAALDIRGWSPMRDSVAEAVASGTLAGDPDELAHICWAAIHGLVTLHLAGKLRLGRDLDSLVDPLVDLLLAGARPTAKPKRKRSR